MYSWINKKMSTSICIYCKKEFTYLTEEEYLLGRFTDKQKETLNVYINSFVHYGFNFRCSSKNEDKIFRLETLQKILDIIQETTDEIKGTEAQKKISNYCPHIADYTISRVILNSPGLLRYLAKRTTIDFNDFDFHTKHSLGTCLLLKFDASMFILYNILGFNFEEELLHNYGNNKFFILSYVIQHKRLFLTKFFLSLGVPVKKSDIFLSQDWQGMVELLGQIYINECKD